MAIPKAAKPTPATPPSPPPEPPKPREVTATPDGGVVEVKNALGNTPKP